MCTLDIHLFIIIGIMIAAGAFGGYLNSLHNFDTIEEADLLVDPKVNEAERINRLKDINRAKRWKYILLGIGSAFLVPAFLKMISSNLAERSENNINYLIFTGFCLVAAIFSRRFVKGIGEKILEKLKETDKKATAAVNKATVAEVVAEKASTVVEKNEDTLQALVFTASERDDTQEIKNTNTSRSPEVTIGTTEFAAKAAQRKKVVTSLKRGPFTFRTLNGIIKETDLEETLVIELLNDLIGAGIVRKISKDSVTGEPGGLYTLTKSGRIFNQD